MPSDGADEIEANDRRFKSAKKIVALTSRNLEAALKALAVAQKEHDDAQSDLKDAEACLEAAQKKWEVINVDEDNDGNETESSGDDGRVRVESAAIKRPDGDIKSSSEDSKKRGVVSPTQQVESAASKKPRHDTDTDNEYVVVRGCGFSQVDGIYTKSDTGGILGSPMYSKTAMWKGKVRNFVMMWNHHYWRICFLWPDVQDGDENFYWAPSTSSTTPPTMGWFRAASGEDPAPEIKIVPSTKHRLEMKVESG